jgi:hypothetical protein
MVYKDENIEVLDINEQTWNMNTDNEYIMNLDRDMEVDSNSNIR